KHQYQWGRRSGVAQQLDEDRRTDVVGQIGDDLERVSQSPGYLFPRQPQEVGLQDLHRVLALEPRCQGGDESFVFFDQQQFRDALGQGKGQGPLARPDFQDAILALEVEGLQDAVDNSMAAQKMLTERSHNPSTPNSYTRVLVYW